MLQLAAHNITSIFIACLEKSMDLLHTHACLVLALPKGSICLKFKQNSLRGRPHTHTHDKSQLQTSLAKFKLLKNFCDVWNRNTETEWDREKERERPVTVVCCVASPFLYSLLSSLSLCFLHLTLNNVGIYARTIHSIYLWICPSIYQFSLNTMCSLEFSDNRTTDSTMRDENVRYNRRL